MFFNLELNYQIKCVCVCVYTHMHVSMQIPGDMVVNAIVVAMVAHANQAHSDHLIYHIGSSAKSPIRYSNFRDYLYRYFTNKPLIGENAKPIRVSKAFILKNMASFHRYVALRYFPLLKVLNFLISFYINIVDFKLN